jgi:phosphoglycolate phosphatase-like HAD superfamily hydrolase
MQPVEAILFEPVGCLAEFPPEPFQEAAARLFGRKRKPSRSGSRSYWHLLNLIEASGGNIDENLIQALELEAVARASIYEDVPPALAELASMGVQLLIASSLSHAAVARFVEKCPGFSGIWNRNNSQGIKAAPLRCALASASLHCGQTLYLVDTAEALNVAKAAGVNGILMMNDPDEARRLALQEPSGGIVSLHELPDFVRVVAANASR